MKPQVADSAEKLSAELVITTYISVGSPCKYLKVRICIDSGSRVPLLFRRNLISNLRRAQNPIKMCTASDQPLPGGSMGSDLSIALPIALPNAKGELVERNYRLQEWGYEGAIGGGGVDILLGYPILVKYGIAILPRLDMLTLDSFAGSRPTPPQKARDPASTVPVSKIGEEAIVVPDSGALDKAVQRQRKRKGNKVEPTCNPIFPPAGPKNRQSAQYQTNPLPQNSGTPASQRVEKAKLLPTKYMMSTREQTPPPERLFGKVKPPVFHVTPAAKAPPPNQFGPRGKRPPPKGVTIEG